MKRRTLVAFVFCFMLCMLVNHSVFADETMKYTLDADGNATITGMITEVPEVLKIPSTVDEHPVTVIGSEAFANQTAIKAVGIPEGVKTIESNAFANCTSLILINIPASITTIRENAFLNDKIAKINYAGTRPQWQNVIFYESGNGGFGLAKITDSEGKEYYASKQMWILQLKANTVPLVDIKKVVSKSKKTITVKFKEAEVLGYQVQCSTKSNFAKKYTRSKVIASDGEGTVTVKGLLPETRYFVRIRGIKRNDKNKKIYGAWSKVKRIKVKG